MNEKNQPMRMLLRQSGQQSAQLSNMGIRLLTIMMKFGFSLPTF